jgi:RNA polymerase sigma-70 factor (ECF subfamily)
VGARLVPERLDLSEPDAVAPIEVLLRSARAGSENALGALLESCRDYLLLVATRELQPDIQSKLGASDVVQETFLDAQRDFSRFSGLSRDDLLIWLRAILLNNLRDTERCFRAARRDVAREVSLGNSGDSHPALRESGVCVETPSWLARLRERDDGIWRAIDSLSQEHRDVIVARNLELASFVLIGRRMGRSADAVRKLWARAIQALQNELEEHNGSRSH